jgi:transaldolase / glucose-6-phosphate isomerase
LNPLQRLVEAGQSIWLDYLRRSLITGGGLKELMDKDAVGGLTSNPTIFGRAIAASTDYDEGIHKLVAGQRSSPRDVFYELALEDIVMAADVFSTVYERTARKDGFVSFELEPAVAHDTEASIKAARELVGKIARPNVMIKVPGTPAGVPAVEELTAAGVNVNITLLFSVDMYERVAHAYITGLERRLEMGQSLDSVASVASFFVSRVDSAVDALLHEGSPLAGKVAIANAKVAYQQFQRIFSGARWERLAAAGARVQRPLWASTGTKNPAYSDVVYVEELVAPDTVNTMPEATLDAFRDHGRVRSRAAAEGVEEAESTLAQLEETGIDLGEITGRLIDDGIATFTTDFAKLLARIEAKMQEKGTKSERPPSPARPVEARIQRRLDDIRENDIVGRIWRKDHTVWKPQASEISNRLGWLDAPELMRERVADLQVFAKQVVTDGFSHAVLLGMGGSSLAPEVLAKTLGAAKGSVDVTLLDTTHPTAIASVERSLDISKTLFLVASKSGTTVETLSHLAYFYDKVKDGHQFVAITDAGTPLEALARERHFRSVFLNPSDIGGRYSALSLFGLVPAALMGLDLNELLESAEEMASACARCVPCHDNPGAWLGTVMGEAALAERDKLTILSTPGMESFGGWIEQLIAESTGKEGRGILPVVGEELGAAEVYGDDRLFISLGDVDASLDELEHARHPVVRLTDVEPARLGAEFFRWEFAAAVAGHVLGINPFDQPNVAEAKEATRRALETTDSEATQRGDIAGLLRDLRRGDYVSIHAYLPPAPETEQALGRARLAIRDRHRVATTVGFGPRFLHSTGQLHKGGAANGAFIQVVDRPEEDLVIPGERYTFGALIEAQARGDLYALRQRGRRAVRVQFDQLMEVI